MIRTRNAPSPTGYAHLGTIYQSMIDKAYAVRNNGAFILRIEDTDQNRFFEDAEATIMNGLDWFGLTPDESPIHGGNFGPYRQSERLNLYHKYAKELVDNGHAYYCFCSQERLQQIREKDQSEGKSPMYDKSCRNIDFAEAQKRFDAGEKAVIRMKVPENQKIVVNDLVRGDIEFDSNVVDDQVILKSDGYPTYHLAVVVDDHLMEITHVLRGPEWITSFPKHKLLYDFFGWKMPIFVHTPVITNMHDGKKLSKRDGHTSVDWYRFKGYLPEAVFNFIALLGWSHPEEKEIFSWDEYVKVFDLKDLSAASPKFDLVKLEWMNGQYFQSLENENFIKRLLEWLTYCSTNEFKGATEYVSNWTKTDYKRFFDFVSNLDEEKKILFAEITKPRIKKFEDLLPLNNFFIDEVNFDVDLLVQQKSKDKVFSHLKWFVSQFESCDWTLKGLKEIELQTIERAKELGWKTGEAFYPLRISLCGSKISPPLFESVFILGRQIVLDKLESSIKILAN